MVKADKRKKLDEVFDILLSSVNPERVPDKIGWELAYLAKEDKLYSRKGMLLLIKAASLCEPEKMRKIKEERRRK